MSKYLCLIIISFICVSCASTPQEDLSHVPTFIYPNVKQLTSLDQDVIFTKEERKKAIRMAKADNASVLYTIYTNEDGDVEKIRTNILDKAVHEYFVYNLKSRLKSGNYYDGSGRPSAFFFQARFDIEIEYDEG